MNLWFSNWLSVSDLRIKTLLVSSVELSSISHCTDYSLDFTIWNTKLWETLKTSDTFLSFYSLILVGQGGFLEVYKNVQEERKKFKFERNRQDTWFKGEHRIEEKTVLFATFFCCCWGTQSAPGELRKPWLIQGVYFLMNTNSLLCFLSLWGVGYSAVMFLYIWHMGEIILCQSFPLTDFSADTH